MKGFKDFVMRGNLVEIAVAFVMAAAFAAVVTAFVKIVMDLIGKLGGTPDFSSYKPGGVSVGGFLTALITFLILAAVVYSFVVKPYEAAKARLFPSTQTDEAPDADVALLTEIRDLLASRGPEV
jgi:large conductance mechanosensitive channel